MARLITILSLDKRSALPISLVVNAETLSFAAFVARCHPSVQWVHMATSCTGLLGLSPFGSRSHCTVGRRCNTGKYRERRSMWRPRRGRTGTVRKGNLNETAVADRAEACVVVALPLSPPSADRNWILRWTIALAWTGKLGRRGWRLQFKDGDFYSMACADERACSL